MFFRQTFYSIVLLLSLLWQLTFASNVPQVICDTGLDGRPLPCSHQKQHPSCIYCASDSNFLQWCENGISVFNGTCATSCHSVSRGCSCPRSSLTQSECSFDLGQGECDPRGFCVCKEGYEGSACENTTKLNLCTSKQDGIYCTVQGQQYHCKSGTLTTIIACSYGCEEGVGCLCPNNCSNYGTCMSATTHGTCQCESGYVDDDCSLGPLTIRGLWLNVWNKQQHVDVALENCYMLGERCGIIDWRTLQCSGLVTYEGTSVIGSHSQDFAGRKAILFSYEITCNYGCLRNTVNFGEIEIVRKNSGTGHYVWWGVFLNRNYSENVFHSYFKDPLIHPSCNPNSPSSNSFPTPPPTPVTPSVYPPLNPLPHHLPLTNLTDSDKSNEKFLQTHLIPIIVGVFMSGLLIGVLGASATNFIRARIRNNKQHSDYALVD